MSGVSGLHKLPHLILIITLQHEHQCFADEENAMLKRVVSCHVVESGCKVRLKKKRVSCLMKTF